MRQEIESAGRWEIEVLYGVYNLFNHQVTMPNDPFAAPSERTSTWLHAPTNPREFSALALQMAEILKPHQTSTKPLESVEKEIVVQFLSFSGEPMASTSKRPADLDEGVHGRVAVRDWQPDAHSCRHRRVVDPFPPAAVSRPGVSHSGKLNHPVLCRTGVRQRRCKPPHRAKTR